MRRRFLGAVCIAVILGGTPAAVATATGWHPLCVLYEEGSVMWYLLACFAGDPTVPPDGNG